MGAFDRFKEKLLGEKGEEFFDEDSPTTPTEDYIEINSPAETKSKAKIMVKPFIINEFQDIKPALDSLREGYTIALVNIKPIKDKDIVELKRAINKLKKTCDAIEGDIAGFGEDWIVVTPSFAEVHRTLSAPQTSQPTQPEIKDI
jgi:SepF-like predicted cell division protein (DUF552 family)